MKELWTASRYITPACATAFADYLREQERERATVEKYLRYLHVFAVWLNGGEATKEAAVAWKEELVTRRMSVSTINGALSAVNAFFRFAGWEECRVKSLRVQRRAFRDPERDLSRTEYGRLVSAAQAQGQTRLVLLLETICSTGIRVSEVRSITVEAARAGRAQVTLKGKTRIILLPGKLCHKLLKYAKKQKINAGEIFLTRNGKGISRRQIWAEMKALCSVAGVSEKKVFPHNLRHLFAKEFYRVCRDIVKLADVLGHASIETTRIYLVTTGAEHLRQLERLRLIS